MGFDLVALRPKSEDEKHCSFHNNVWWWRPLWRYCHIIGVINDKQFESGNYNNGEKISREQAEEIGIRLLHLLEQGETKRYSVKYAEWKDTLPESNWEKHYPFDEDNVKNFAWFCLNSGGFEIC